MISRIQPDMSMDQMKLLTGVRGQLSMWSGQTGFFEFRLASGKILTVSCYEKNSAYYVYPKLVVYLQEHEGDPLKRVK